MNVPWWAKIGLKIIASRVPLSYDQWFKLGFFRHGMMDDFTYAKAIVARHTQAAFPDGVPAGATCLEIGPGDSVFTALSARHAGFSFSIMVDVGRFSRCTLEQFQQAAREAGIEPSRLGAWSSIDEALSALDARYLVEGLQSMKELPDNSVDLVYSQAVLEHIRAPEYTEFIAETHRVLKSGGFSSHQVDLRDHLGGGLNNLRFGSKIWESDLFSSSGFYTNRLSMEDSLAAFDAAGFTILRCEPQCFDRLPIRRDQLAPEFRSRNKSQLQTRDFYLLARA